MKRLFEDDFSILVIENLKNLKHGKSGKWSKSVNRKFNFWIYSYIIRRLEQLCEVAGVQCHKVMPQYTSQTCPRCSFTAKSNRRGEMFKCQECGYTEDSDYVGALNILQRFAQEPIVPVVSKLVA